MSLRYFRHAELDFTAWDECVQAASAAVPYAYSWWLREACGRWDAVIEVEEATGAYKSLLPLPLKRRPWGYEVFQPAFTQQLGLLLTGTSRFRYIIDYLKVIDKRFARFYLQLHTGNELVAAPPGFALTERRTFHLNLAASYATLAAGYAPDYRRRLRHNQQLPTPLQVTEAASAKNLMQLFKNQEIAAASGLKTKEYYCLERLVATLQTRKQVYILEVRMPESGELLAGALFVRQPSVVVYLFAAASAAGKKAGAPLLLLDHVIQRHAGTPGLTLDFEGSMIPSIARFFANFGAAPVPYGVLTQTRQPWYLQWIR
ncbi:GNAT family N-acetyltransferase [Hymenobacter jejuensis]|uniref:GNAT family N-acetyltransferase n=1 Tax=Hymenobacter jejuensis TaxID=2502781 RepID=UPI0013FD04D1|nr:GNAT family N-acetyltransferase [Hymenobacter jejuensis]